MLVTKIPDHSAFLDGSAGIAVLAFGLAISVYLRNVSNDTQNKIETLLSIGSSSVWHSSPELFEKRLKILRQTRIKIEKITPFMFGFSVFVGLRISLFQFPEDTVIYFVSASNIELLDALILCALTSAVAWMWLSHSRLKKAEKIVRDEMFTCHGQPADVEFRLQLNRKGVPDDASS